MQIFSRHKFSLIASSLLLAFCFHTLAHARTAKPVLHGKHWVAITGKPLAATAGALTFAKGGNAVDAACAMLAATATMWDTLGWGGETQALIYNPKTGKVIGINALGVAPTGATVEFFKNKGMLYPPEYGPLAAVTPGTPGGLMVMLANYGKLSLAEVLQPAMEMAKGYPIEKSQADNMERRRDIIAQWPDSKRIARISNRHPGSYHRDSFVRTSPESNPAGGKNVSIEFVAYETACPKIKGRSTSCD